MFFLHNSTILGHFVIFNIFIYHFHIRGFLKIEILKNLKEVEP
jgi:hypothetical protein